jgi:hypothetical protein
MILTLALSHLFCITTGRILDFSNADMAVDQYHRFKVNCKDTFVEFICIFNIKAQVDKFKLFFLFFSFNFIIV